MGVNDIPNQPLNKNELDMIKSKLSQLQETMNLFLQSVDPETSPHFSNWGDMLSKFNVLVAKFVNYNNEITRNDMYNSTLLYPNNILLNEQDANVLGYLLRTKQIPEIEKEEEKLLKEGFPGLDEVDENTLREVDLEAQKKLLERWKNRVERHDKRSSKALEAFDKICSKHDFKKRPKKEVKEIIIEKEVQSPASETSNSSKKNDNLPSVKSLDQLLGLYSSGRRFDS